MNNWRGKYSKCDGTGYIQSCREVKRGTGTGGKKRKAMTKEEEKETEEKLEEGKKEK